MKPHLAILCAMVASAIASADTAYKLPPKEIVDLVDAPPTPETVVSPTRDTMLLVDYEANQPIALVARPFLRLAGVRIDPRMGARQRTRRYTGITILAIEKRTAPRVGLPRSATIGLPAFSHDGRRIAFTRDLEDGVELWVAESATGKAGPVGRVRLNDVLVADRLGAPAAPFAWMSDGRRVLARLVPAGRGAPPARPVVPTGPVIEDTAGRKSQVPTFQDLLQDSHDEDVFEHYGGSQLAVVDTQSGAVTPIGALGLYTAAEFSPDEKHVLVTRLRRPFSFRVPFASFTRSVEVWDAAGRRLASVADLPVSDEVPRHGVPTGPRAVDWQPLQPSALVWVEALDGGDPLKKVPHRDKVMASTAPFSDPPRELLRLKHRFARFDWTARKDVALVEERDRDRRWTTTHLVDLAAPAGMKVVFDRSVNDAYKDPGRPVIETRPTGERTILQDGDVIYLAGEGASERGDRPFLDKLDLATRARQRLHQSDEASHERFETFVKDSRATIVTRHESRTEPPNWFAVDLASGRRTKLTALPDPAPRFARIRKELLRYARNDGVPLSGTLYLPADHQPGTRLPLIIWAYPREYSSDDTAGQVRASPSAFARPTGASPLFFVTQGYALLNDATMPVVGDPETMNDTYIEQISAAAEAAIAKLDSMGVIDPRRVGVAGHSYGAFMTVNLLAHTDLFAAGLARSGAYNRSLTPFGFQSERRSYWEATDLYTRVSPFTYANRINEPLLLIHGQADNNSGTFPLQSERLFQAIRGNGGTARLVMLPYESHGYRARESLLHTVAEMIEWADRYVKGRRQVGVPPGND